MKKIKFSELLIVWVIILVLFVPTLSVIFGYPTSYVVEYTISWSE